MTIYTIGYAGGMTPLAIRATAEELDALVIDVRSSPRSRIPGFGFKALHEVLGATYAQAPELGGREDPDGKPFQEGIKRLRAYEGEHRHCLLMCLEHDPWMCHRHHTITAPHFPAALHLYDGAFYTSKNVADAIADKSETVGLVAIGGLAGVV